MYYGGVITATMKDFKKMCMTANLLGYAEGIGAIPKYNDTDIVNLCAFIIEHHSMDDGVRHITMDELKRLITGFYNERRTNS